MAAARFLLNCSSSDINFKLSCDAILALQKPMDKLRLDSLLAQSDPNQPEIVLPTGERFCWYFAIGSMINPISLHLREIESITSFPATCLEHKLVFRCHNGIADFEACPGTRFDGVVHLIPHAHMLRLDEIECFYRRMVIECVDYRGQTRKAYAYQIKVHSPVVSPPHERYLDVIIKGCEYYQIRPDYIMQLREQQTVVPRQKPEQFRSFSDYPPDIYYAAEDLQKHNGSDPSLPLWIAINGKILEYAGLPASDHSDYNLQYSFLTFVQPNLAGREVTSVIAKTLYEPLYKLPLSDKDICDEHRARIEDYYWHMLSSLEHQTYWKAIGRLRRADD